MHLKLSLILYSLTCLVSILLDSVSTQLILPKEYIHTVDSIKIDEHSFPGQRPGHESIASSQQRKEYLKQVEGHLLQMFGLNSRPKPGNKNPQVHPYLVHLYSNSVQSNSIDNNMSNIVNRRSKRKKVRSVNDRITIKGSHNTIRSHDLKESGHFDSRLLKFEVSLPHEEDLKGAELRPPHSLLLSSNLVNKLNNTQNNNNNEDRQEILTENLISIQESSLNKSNSRRMNKDRRRIDIHEILSNPSNKDFDKIITRIIDTQLIDNSNDWSSFDVLPAVERWFKDPSTNFGIYISISHVNGTQLANFNLVNSSEQSGPILVTYSNDLKGQEQEKVRMKRGTGGGFNRKHRRKGRKDHCRRQPLYVDFSDVGWTDWIVAPHGYQAYFCQGECPYPLDDHFNTTNHAIVQTLVNSVSPQMVPRACCIPTELSAISMLYVDENDKVVLKSYQDMVVEGCGCR